MAKNMRVHELAKELGMTNAEAMELAGALGVPVKSHSSSLNEAYADMMRRRAVRDGLTRDEQPEEPKVSGEEGEPAEGSASDEADAARAQSEAEGEPAGDTEGAPAEGREPPG